MKKLVSLLLATMLLLSFGGQALAQEPVELVFITLYGDKLASVVEQYYQETGVKVNLENYAIQDLLDMIEVKIGAGNSDYDLINVDVPLVASYASRNMILPLDAYFTEDEKLLLTKSSVEAGSYKDSFYSSPMQTSTQLLWYNTMLLEEAGVTLDTYTVEKRITWEELEEIAGKVLKTIDPDGTKGIIGIQLRQVDKVYQMNQLPNSMGGANIGDDGLSVAGVIDSEPWIKALTWYQEMVSKGLTSRGVSASETKNLFYSDKIVFLVDTTAMPPSLDKRGITHYGYMPVPAFKGYEDKVATPTGSWHISVNKDSKHPDEAAAFIKWLTVGEGAKLWYESCGELPTLLSLQEELVNEKDCPEWLRIAFYESANTAFARAITPGFNEYADVLNAMWADIRNGENIEECVQWAIGEVDSAMSKYR